MSHSPALDDYLLALLDSAPASTVEPARAVVDLAANEPTETTEATAPAEIAASASASGADRADSADSMLVDSVLAETMAAGSAVAVTLKEVTQAAAPVGVTAVTAPASAPLASPLIGNATAAPETEDGKPDMGSQTATATPEHRRESHPLPDIRIRPAPRADGAGGIARQPAAPITPAHAPSPAAARPSSHAAPRYVAPAPLPLGQQHDRGHQHRRASERTTRWLRMRCDEQHYALELLKVQEVVRPGTLLPLRGSPRHMLGVMNLRGQVVPVLDLGVYLGRPAIVPDSATRIVVLEENGEVLGLRVTAVEDVTNLTDQQIEPPDNSRMCRLTSQLFRGVARLGGHAVVLLDASQLLG
jgi:purine-binding chemotaxis protein CheW